jgi:DNA polymerase III subunit beta
MRWRAERDELRNAVDVARAAVGRHHLAVLSGLHLTAGPDGVLQVVGTDLDLTITAEAKGGTDEPGSVIVSAALLHGWLAKAPSAAVTLATTDDGRLTIEAGSAAATLHTYDGEQWPRLTEPTGEPTVLDAADWERLARILPFALTDQDRPLLRVVRFRPDGAWTTDGYRLGWVKDLAPGFTASIPTPVLFAVRRHVPDGPVTLTVDERHATFTAAGVRWTQRLDEGNFPETVDKLVPQGGELTVDVDTGELTDALARAMSVAREGVGVRLTASEDHITVTTHSVDVGETTEDVDAGVTGEFEVGFNPAYLAQLAAAMGERVTLTGTDALKPWIAEHDGVVALLMPFKVNA